MKIPAWIKRRRIGVLYGGFSEESAISRRTGKAVLKGFQDLGVQAVGIEVDRSLAGKLKALKIGYCFIALHGKYGEDGTVQGLCEMMGIPYSGSGVLASAVAMNKAFAKSVLQGSGIRTAPFEVVSGSGGSLKIGLPAVVKPIDGGSAIGVSIVRRKKDLRAAVRSALKYSRRALIEKFVHGKEVTAPVLGEKVLPLIEIVPKSSFYDFRAKYVPGMSKHILPARISKSSENLVRESALKAHRALGCRAFSRVDFIVDDAGRPWFLELNTIPGMTETSLFPESARAAGYSFSGMLLEMVRQSET